MRLFSICALIASVPIATAQTTARAAAKEFDFKDPKGVNSIAFVLDSLLEPIMGVTTGISGKVSFDPENPKATKGKIAVDAKSLHIENRGMKDTLHGPDWLDVQKHPTIEFTIKDVKQVSTPEPNVFELDVTGDLTCKGVTKPLATKVTATYLPDQLENRSGRMKGDLLLLRSNFVMKRGDFDIKKDMTDKVVAEEIELRVAIAGCFKK